MLLILIALLSAVAQAGPPPQEPAPPPSCPELATALNRVIVNDVRFRDWPQLNRYRDANRTLASAPSGEARVVFMGDSITDAWQQPRFGGFFPGKPYVDRGISGQTTPQMLIRFKPDVVALKPKAVVILAGTNDIAANTGPETDEEIEQNLASMSEIAHANGIKVVFASITPVSEYHVAERGTPQTTLRPMARIKTINEWLKSYAASRGDVYLDYFSGMTDDKGLLRAELSGDDLHPNAAGYAIMGPLAEAAIQKALK
jgi:acyl-CoA thioesterase I